VVRVPRYGSLLSGYRLLYAVRCALNGCMATLLMVHTDVYCCYVRDFIETIAFYQSSVKVFENGLRR
jgi:hypothetical protein